MDKINKMDKMVNNSNKMAKMRKLQMKAWKSNVRYVVKTKNTNNVFAVR